MACASPGSAGWRWGERVWLDCLWGSTSGGSPGCEERILLLGRHGDWAPGQINVFYYWALRLCYLYVRMRVQVHVYVYMYVHVCTCVPMCACACLYMCVRVCMCTFVCRCVHAYACVHMCVYMCTCVHVYLPSEGNGPFIRALKDLWSRGTWPRCLKRPCCVWDIAFLWGSADLVVFTEAKLSWRIRKKLCSLFKTQNCEELLIWFLISFWCL